MLADARNQTTLESTYVPLGHVLIGAGRSSEAIELIKKSSEDAQHGQLMALIGHWSFLEPLDLLNHLEKIPDPSLRREAAIGIAINPNLHISLTKEHRESLKEYLPDYYWDKL